MPKIKQLFLNILLSLGVILFLLLCIEGINYFIVTNPGGYYVWAPGTTQNFEPDSDIFTGIAGKSSFTINEQGYRGDLAGENPSILFVGGSTTECLYLDDSEAWPYLVQEELSLSGWAHTSINVGRSGHSTKEHVLQMEHLVDQYNPSYIVMLVGINDLVIRVGKADSWKPYQPNYDTAFTLSPGRFNYRKTLTFRVAKLLYVHFFTDTLREDTTGAVYATRRAVRQTYIELDTAPNIEGGLDYYRNHLEEIAELARLKGVPLVFLTQPTLWHENMTADEDASLWVTIDNNGYSYRPEMMADLLDLYNDELLSICARYDGIYCFDLSGRIPQNLEHFYDDVHFNEQGSRRVAAEVSSYLLETFANP